jgi:hypothetical protein
MIQMTELHFRQTPARDFAAVKARAQEILQSELDSSDPHDADKAFLIFHKSHIVNYSDGQIPAQTAILASDHPSNFEAYREDIEQSWRCRRAEELLRGCQESLLVTEMMARLLPPQDRVSIFHGVLQAVIEATKPDALVFKHSQQVVEPADYLAACGEAPMSRPGSLNIRFFNISNSDGDFLMDTRGLAATTTAKHGASLRRSTIRRSMTATRASSRRNPALCSSVGLRRSSLPIRP